MDFEGKLEAQVKQLVDAAPQDGKTPQLVTAIAPVLLHFATQLQRENFYVLQTLNGDWVRTTLSSRREQGVQKSVIYAFASVDDARKSPMPTKDPNVLAAPVPVTHVLFQMVALKTLDSLVFFATEGNLNNGTEVGRAVFEETMKAYFEQVQDWQEGEDVTIA
ncbi:MAG: hypothetical protein ACFCA4_13305 [Cyanophyceae cyanobacterium]